MAYDPRLLQPVVVQPFLLGFHHVRQVFFAYMNIAHDETVNIYGFKYFINIRFLVKDSSGPWSDVTELSRKGPPAGSMVSAPLNYMSLHRSLCATIRECEGDTEQAWLDCPIDEQMILHKPAIRIGHPNDQSP